MMPICPLLKPIPACVHTGCLLLLQFLPYPTLLLQVLCVLYYPISPTCLQAAH